MRYQVAILTADTRFARLLQLEFEAWHLSVGLMQDDGPQDAADVLLVDLDSAEVPQESRYGYLIGFSRLPAISADADARRCALILRRPFRMSLLRWEVLSALSAGSAKQVQDDGEREVLTLTADGVRCGERTVRLTPTERQLLSLLLEANGNTVPKDGMDAVTGDTGNGATAVYICEIRKKLSQAGLRTTVGTVRGVGYCLETAEKNRKSP